MSGKMKHLVLAVACLPSFAACAGDVGDAESSDLAQGEEGVEAVQLLHLSFGADVSDEEIEAQWQEAVENMASSGALPSAITNDRNFNNCYFTNGFLCPNPLLTVATRTGTGTNDGTDGRVDARIYYEGGSSAYGTAQLDNAGDDRERGDYDMYMFYLPEVPPTFRFTQARISLKGTDGWGLDYFEIRSHTNYQYANENYTGSTGCYRTTRQWLDSSSSSSWEHSYTTDCYGEMTSPNTLEL